MLLEKCLISVNIWVTVLQPLGIAADAAPRRLELKRMSKKAKIIGVVIAGIVALFIAAVTASFVASRIILKVSDPYKITGMTQYYVLKDGSLYKIRFSLTDANNAIVASGAHVSFKAQANSSPINGSGSPSVIYTKDFDIRSTGFQTYQLVLTGAPIVAYAWQVKRYRNAAVAVRFVLPDCNLNCDPTREENTKCVGHIFLNRLCSSGRELGR